MQTVGDMTLEELKQLIKDELDERLTRALGTFEEPDEDDDEANMTWDEVRALADRYRWTPPPGSKSSLELLREDRES